MSLRFSILVFIFLTIFNVSLGLKLKIGSFNILKMSKKIGSEQLIRYLIRNGPYDLLGELLNLRSVDFKSIGVKKCSLITSTIILEIINEYSIGKISDEHYKGILSSDCIGNLSKKVLNELLYIDVVKFLPINLLELKNFDIKAIDYTEDFMMILKDAWTSETREKIIWTRWTSRFDIYQGELIFKHILWNEEKNLWQSINFRNFEELETRELNINLQLINFIGLKYRPLARINLDELIQRCYTLLSFIKVTEVRYQNHLSSFSPSSVGKTSISSYQQMQLKIISANIGIFSRIKNRIKEISEIEADNLKNLLDFCFSEPAMTKEGEIEKVNNFVSKFLESSKTIVIGDWLVGIVYILSDHIKLITFETIKELIEEFFSRNPSIDCIEFIFKVLLGKWNDPIKIDQLFYDQIKDKPNYLIELYKNDRKLLSQKFIQLIPLRLRVIENLRNRFYTFPNIRGLEINLLKYPIVSSLRKMMEMVEVFGWKKININQPVEVKDVDGTSKEFRIDKILKLYFEFFMEQELFYDVKGIDRDGRPIIRLLPIFPVEMWEQFGHLINRANLLNIKIPFILDYEFFNNIFVQDARFLEEMSVEVELQLDLRSKDIYKWVQMNSDLNNENLEHKLIELCSKIEERSEKICLSSKTFEPGGSPSRKITRCRSHTELSEFSKMASEGMATNVDLFRIGLESFEKGLRVGMNLEDFSIEEAYNLIFFPIVD